MSGSTSGVNIDTATYAAMTIEYEHHEIHSGSSFACHYENFCTNAGEQTVIAFNTPNTTKWLHIVAVGSCTAVTRFSIVENPTIDNDEGTQLTIYNRDRNETTKTSGVTSIESTPVANKATSFNEAQAENANITETTQLDSIIIGSGGAGASGGIGGSARAGAEWILKQNTQYAFIAESMDANNNYHTIELTWYEHTNKE